MIKVCVAWDLTHKCGSVLKATETELTQHLVIFFLFPVLSFSPSVPVAFGELYLAGKLTSSDQKIIVARG